MPSQFETLFGNGRALMLRNHGTTVTCTAAGAAAGVAATAIVGAVSGEMFEDPNTRQTLFQRTMQIPTDTVPNVARKMLVDVGGGDIWTIDDVLGIEGGLARVRAVKPVRQERGGRAGR